MERIPIRYEYINIEETEKSEPDEDVIQFIKEFTQYEQNNALADTFTKGFCYYFALILQERFEGSILYDYISGHFVTKIDERLYDITGDVTDKYKNLYTKEEWLQVPSIIKGCILKGEN